MLKERNRSEIYALLGFFLYVLALEDKTGKFFFPKRRFEITTVRFVISQKSADFIYIAAKFT